MAFLKFNKSELVNLSYSLKREIILANKTGAYCNTSIVDCNTRRYHGLLAVPVDNLDGQQMLLLSSLDESIILEGHQFNLAIHRYGTVYEPRVTSTLWTSTPTLLLSSPTRSETWCSPSSS